MSTLGDLFITVGAKIDGFKQAMGEVDEHLESTGDKVGKLAGFISGNLAKALGELSFAGVAIAAFHAAESFEEATFKIQQATGATGEALVGMEETMKMVYAESSASAESIAVALSQITRMTGATGEALEALTLTSVQFARVTGQDVKSSVETNQRLFASYTTAVEDQAAAMDELLVASQKSGISTQRLSETMITLGPVFRAFNLNFQDATAIVATFSKTGLDAADMARGLNTAFAKFADAGKDPQQALLALIDSMKNAATFADAVNYALEIGFKGKAAVALADAARKGALDLDAMTKALENSRGAVEKTDEKTKTLGERFTELGHAINVGLAPLAGPVLKAITDVVGALGQMIVLAEKGTLKLQDLFTYMIKGGGAAAAAAVGVNAAARAAQEGKLPPTKPPGGEGLTKPPGGGGAATATGEGPPAGFIKFSRAIPFEQLSLQNAILVDQMRQRQAEEARLIDLEAKAGGTELYHAQNTAKLAKAMELLNEPPAIDGLAKLDKTGQDTDKTLQKLGLDSKSVAQDMLQSQPWYKLSDGAQYFGITTKDQAEQAAKVAVAKFDEMLASGLATDRELAIAALMTAQAEIDADYAAGAISHERWQQESRDIKANLDQITISNTQIKQSRFDLAKELENSSHRMFDSFERDMAKDIVQWGDWAKDIKQIGLNFAQDMLSIILKGLFKPLEDEFAKLATKIGGFFGSLFGGGSSAAGSAAGAAGSAGSSAASGIGGAVSSIGGILGAAGAVGGIVSAVSGVIGNFQMHGMNKTLDLIENYTRYLKIGLVEQADSLLNDSHLIRNKIVELVSFSWDVLAKYLFNLNVDLDEIVNLLRGGKFSTTIGTLTGSFDTGPIVDVCNRIVDAVDTGVERLADILQSVTLPASFAQASPLLAAAPAAAGGGVTVDMRGSTFHGVSKESVNQVMREAVKQVRLADPRRRF